MTSQDLAGHNATDVGGLVGYLGENDANGGRGSIIDSYATGNVVGKVSVGGLVGQNYAGHIVRSYAAGSVTSVTGSTWVGGLVGRTGAAGIVENSFFNTQTSGQSIACGTDNGQCSATGLTTAQMKSSAPFTAAGWDFTNVWAIDPAINNGYPYLRATVVAAPPPPPPPPPPPVTTLTVNGVAASYSASAAPYQPTIAVTGSGFSDVTEVRFTWTDPSGQTGTSIWNAANSFGGGRFIVGAGGNSATIAPTLVAANDPSGTYQWTVTFVAGAQTVARNFSVTYTPVVTPPPPPPPSTLTINGVATAYSTATAPYQPTIALTGAGFSNVTEVRFTWTDPSGQTGTSIWNAANQFNEGRFVVGAGGNSATIRPVLLLAGDPSGAYQWTVTFVAGTQSVVRNFSVNYTPVVAPPPPPPAVTPLTVSGIASGYSATTAPFQPPIELTGSGFSNVTEVRLSWTGPNGQVGSKTWTATDNFDGKFVVGTGGNSATIRPLLLVAGDPAGAYQWTVTFIAGSQTVIKTFGVTYTPVVAPPPPPPPPPPVALALTSDLMGLTFGGPTPWQPALRITGRGLDTVTSVTLRWIDPRGTPGSRTFVKGDSLFSSRFVPSADGTSATLSPRLLALNDPPGLYQWTLTLENGGQPVSDRFNVTYAAPALEAPVTNIEPNLGDSTIDSIWNSGAVSLVQIDPFTNINNATPGQLQTAEDNWEYAILSNNVYRNGRELPEPDGWTRLDTHNDVAGFYAETWLITDANGNSKIVMVFRGTEGPTEVDDWLFGNLTPVMTPAQEAIARDYARFVENSIIPNYPNATVIATGHSLGGALAKVAADEVGTTAVVFNSSPRGPDNGNVVYVEETGDGLDSVRSDDDDAVQYNFSNNGPVQSHDIRPLAENMRSLAEAE